MTLILPLSFSTLCIAAQGNADQKPRVPGFEVSSVRQNTQR